MFLLCIFLCQYLYNLIPRAAVGEITEGKKESSSFYLTAREAAGVRLCQGERRARGSGAAAPALLSGPGGPGLLGQGPPGSELCPAPC